MRTALLLLFMATASSFAAATAPAGETPAEAVAREWFMAMLEGRKDRVDDLTRVPFVCQEGILRTKEQLRQYVLTPMGARKPDDKLADLKPERVKVKTVARPKSADPRMTQWLDEADARVYVAISLGDRTTVLFLTKGTKPKVVGVGK